ncbi:GatB/YqeY domain-containing protein [Chloroflexota bacterium]
MEVDLKQKLTDDLKQAMKEGNTLKRSVIRLALSAIKNAEIARHEALKDEDVLGIIAKEVRQRRESIEAFRKGQREDLASQEEAEMAVLSEYLPQQITREEITLTARKIIEETGAEGPHDKGKVMPQIMALLKGKADGRDINEVVTELLTS